MVSGLPGEAALRRMIDAGQIGQAQVVANQRLAVSEDDVVGWLFRGVCKLFSGNLDEAEQDLTRAFQLAPKRMDVVNALAGAYLANGLPLKALELTSGAVRHAPRNLATLSNHIAALTALQRVHDALPFANRLIGLDAEGDRSRRLLARVLRAVGKYDAAKSYFELSAKAFPADVLRQADVWSCSYMMGERAQVQTAVSRLLHDSGEQPAAWFADLGTRFQDAGLPHLALQCYQKGLAAFGEDLELLMNVGITVQALGNAGEALFYFRRAVAVDEKCASAWYHIALSHQSMRDHAEMTACLEKCLTCDPQHAKAAVVLASWRKEQGNLDEGIALLRGAIAANPSDFDAYMPLVNFLMDKQEFDQAESVLNEADLLGLNKPQIEHTRASLLLKRGDIARANVIFRSILKGEPENPDAMSGLLFTSNYDPELSAIDRANAYKSWNDRFVRWRAPSPSFAYPNRLAARRKIKLGYVSGDFRGHSVAFFFEPLLKSHDRTKFEIYCYANQRGGDATTQRMMALGDHWRWTIDHSDEALAEMIRLDGIDILIDLSNHTAGHRLYMFGMKPAPVQMTTIGMPTTTGLSAIDWRITDKWMDPPGTTEALHSEKLLRIASGWCYQPPDCATDMPVAKLPALEKGHLTLASFNAFGKINPKVFRLWARVLRAVPDAVLIVATGGKADDEVLNETVRKTCASCGLPLERLHLMARKPLQEYMLEHGKVDVLLDAFPYTGATVTAHALWMGVPVVTLAGLAPIHRSATSMMNAVGLPEFVAESPTKYVSIVKRLSNDLVGLATVRSEMRSKMQQSVLMDGPKVTQDLESKFKQVWREWCSAQRSKTQGE